MSMYLPTLLPKPSQNGQREHSITASEEGSKTGHHFLRCQSNLFLAKESVRSFHASSGKASREETFPLTNPQFAKELRFLLKVAIH